VLAGASTRGVLLGILKRTNIKSARISLIYSGNAFLLKTAFVFNLKFYFNNKLKVTNNILFLIIIVTVGCVYGFLFLK